MGNSIVASKTNSFTKPVCFSRISLFSKMECSRYPSSLTLPPSFSISEIIFKVLSGLISMYFANVKGVYPTAGGSYFFQHFQ